MRSLEFSPIGRSGGRGWLHAGLGALVVVVMFTMPPISQDPDDHDFADRRGVSGVPNALNVLSNVPGRRRLWTGVPGPRPVHRRRRGCLQHAGRASAVLDPVRGVLLTGVGSAHYHWMPDNARLFWDRPPMTIGFMALLSSVAERIDLAVGLRLLGSLLAVGVLSALYWRIGEPRGAGDLRPYALVQFGTLVAVPLTCGLFPSRYTGTADLFRVVGWYGWRRSSSSSTTGFPICSG
jgi:hypothetical protein